MANEVETFEQVYAEAMETTGVFPSRQTYAKRYLAAHERELAAKDAEIEKLKATMITKEAFDRVWLTSNNKTIEIINLRSLIRELADALECASSILAEEVGDFREDQKLIAKAREVLNG